jgi:hypothetical protein
MKVGDLIKFSTPDDYPQYEGKLGLIIEERKIDHFIVNVEGRDHPYFVHRVSIEIV